MSKTKSGFFCQQCGYESAKWVGKCPSCENWNTFVEEVIVKGNDKKDNNEWKEYNGVGKLKTISINEVSSAEEKRNYHQRCGSKSSAWWWYCFG
jgi:DNA repair protein RadA/Sms